MTKELDTLLCQKYPEIFRDRNNPASQTLMCWGFDCGDGWFALIDTLCGSLMQSVTAARRNYHERLAARERIMTGMITPTANEYSFLEKYASDASIAEAKATAEREEAQVPVAVQVKEKFGGLRFYTTRGTSEHNTMIRFAESMSYRVCEVCGTTKDAKCYPKGWHRTLCVPCATADGRDTSAALPRRRL